MHSRPYATTELLHADDERGVEARNVTPQPPGQFAELREASQRRLAAMEELIGKVSARAEKIARDMRDGDQITGDFLETGAIRTYFCLKLGNKHFLGLLTKNQFFPETPEIAVFSRDAVDHRVYQSVAVREPTAKEWGYLSIEIEPLVGELANQFRKTAAMFEQYQNEILDSP